MKRLWMLAGVAGLVAGCGSSTSDAPALKTYSYGSASAPVGSQTSAVSAATSSVQTVSGSSANLSNAETAPGLADEVANEIDLANQSGALARTPTVVLPEALRSVPAAAAARRGMAAALRSPGLASAGCAVVGSGSITYSNCSASSDGYSGTLNGNITLSGNTLSWDITYTISINSDGVSATGAFHFSGSLTLTSTTFVGTVRSEYVINASGNGESFNLAETTGLDANLTYVTAPQYCVTGGTMEVRRSVELTGSQSGSYDGGIKFTWNGCGNVTVAIGQ